MSRLHLTLALVFGVSSFGLAAVAPTSGARSSGAVAVETLGSGLKALGSALSR